MSKKKFEDLTKEQQTSLKIAGRNFVIKMFFNGVNFGGLIFLTNLIAIFADLAFFHSTPLLMISVIIIDIIFLQMMLRRNQEIAKSFKEKFDKIIAE